MRLHPQPACSDVVTPTTVPVVTSNIGDGTHVVQVGAVDAGNNFTAASTQTITVDNEAPAPPTPTSPVFATVASERSTISWAEPAGAGLADHPGSRHGLQGSDLPHHEPPCGLRVRAGDRRAPGRPGRLRRERLALRRRRQSRSLPRGALVDHARRTRPVPTTTPTPAPEDAIADTNPPPCDARRREGPAHHQGQRHRDGERPRPPHAQDTHGRPGPHDHEARHGHEPPLPRDAQAPVTPLAHRDPHRPPRRTTITKAIRNR